MWENEANRFELHWISCSCSMKTSLKCLVLRQKIIASYCISESCFFLDIKIEICYSPIFILEICRLLLLKNKSNTLFFIKKIDLSIILDDWLVLIIFFASRPRNQPNFDGTI